jgi:hypothetical protein
MVVGACGDTSDPGDPPQYTPPSVLALGKSTLALHEGTYYRSPDGFCPSVELHVQGDGWVSTHRSTDAFDVSRPQTDADAPLVVQAFVIAPEASVDEAMAAVRQRAEDAGAEVVQDGDTGITVRGGDGPLITSRDGGIALDAVPSGYARVEIGLAPVLSVWWVPDETHGAEAEKLLPTLGAVRSDEKC